MTKVKVVLGSMVSRERKVPRSEPQTTHKSNDNFYKILKKHVKKNRSPVIFLPAQPISEPEHLDFRGPMFFLRESSVLIICWTKQIGEGIRRAALGALSQGQ